MSSSKSQKFPKEIIQLMKETRNKLHPWRLCSMGSHFKGGTTQKIGKDNSDITPFIIPPEFWKCVKSSNGKDILHSEEIILISGMFFPYLTGSPKKDALDFPNGNEFDHLIRGWTRYWNDILEPEKNLDSNLVKALIGSESRFQLNPKPSQSARGLMQITKETRKILGDFKGELKDHFIVANKTEILEAPTNICSGIRWLFHKQKLASGKIGRKATWEEAVAEYKSYLKEYMINPDHRGMGTFRKLFRRLKK